MTDIHDKSTWEFQLFEKKIHEEQECYLCGLTYCSGTCEACPFCGCLDCLEECEECFDVGCSYCGESSCIGDCE